MSPPIGNAVETAAGIPMEESEGDAAGKEVIELDVAWVIEGEERSWKPERGMSVNGPTVN